MSVPTPPRRVVAGEVPEPAVVERYARCLEADLDDNPEERFNPEHVMVLLAYYRSHHPWTPPPTSVGRRVRVATGYFKGDEGTLVAVYPNIVIVRLDKDDRGGEGDGRFQSMQHSSVELLS